MKSELWQRRHAIQIVSALPEEVADALAVLELAKQLVLEFLAEKQPQALDGLDLERGVVVSLSAASNGANR